MSTWPPLQALLSNWDRMSAIPPAPTMASGGEAEGPVGSTCRACPPPPGEKPHSKPQVPGPRRPLTVEVARGVAAPLGLKAFGKE